MGLNNLGLILDIIGAILIFFFGISPALNTEGKINLTLEQTDSNEKTKARTYKKLSKLGLILLSLGFALQLLGNIISKTA